MFQKIVFFLDLKLILPFYHLDQKKNNKFSIKNPKNLEMITTLLFSSRRKMINKNFSKLFLDHKYVAKELDLNLNQRPEELTNEMFYKITMKYEKLFN